MAVDCWHCTKRMSDVDELYAITSAKEGRAQAGVAGGARSTDSLHEICCQGQPLAGHPSAGHQLLYPCQVCRNRLPQSCARGERGSLGGGHLQSVAAVGELAAPCQAPGNQRT